MNQNDVLELFKKEAAKLNRAFFRQNDMVQLLASLVERKFRSVGPYRFCDLQIISCSGQRPSGHRRNNEAIDGSEIPET
jgi:hypothetical protein